MSAFLGPIHHWLYEKIQKQEALTQAILQSAFAVPEQADAAQKLAEACGEVETRPLEECIDTGNIHGWLQGQISIAEARYAKLVTDLLKSNAAKIDQLRVIAFAAGREQPIQENNAAAAFQALNDTLLDGMPCDHVNEMLGQTTDQVCWRHTQCLHHSFWENAGGDVANYYALRDAWIDGMLAESGFEYGNENGNFYIRKKETV